MRDLVPFLERGLVLQAEVGREVDHFHAGRDQLGGLGHGDAVRGREEHDVALLQVGLVRARERDVDVAAQRGKHVGDGQAVFLARSDGGQLRLGVGSEQAQQFHARVAGAANDANFDHVCFPLVNRLILVRTHNFSRLSMHVLHCRMAKVYIRGQSTLF